MLTYDMPSIYSYMLARQPGLALREGWTGIGWLRDDQVCAAVIYEGFNGHTVWAHVAIDAPLTRSFLRAFLAYPFKVCNVPVLHGAVDASNTRLQALASRLGGRVQARVQGAAADGGDVLIYALRGQKGRA